MKVKAKNAREIFDLQAEGIIDDQEALWLATEWAAEWAATRGYDVALVSYDDQGPGEPRRFALQKTDAYRGDEWTAFDGQEHCVVTPKGTVYPS
jgi:hypothetical protein